MSSSAAYHHGNLRETLLDLAEEVIDEEGLSAVTLRELARRAGVSHGAPARHFAGVQELLGVLVERGLQRLGDSVAAAMSQSAGDPRSQFLAFASAYVRFAGERPALLRLLNDTKDRAGASRLNQLAADTFAAPIAALAAIGSRGRKRIDVDDLDVQRALSAVLIGLGQLVAGGVISVDEIDRVVAVAVGSVLQGLLHGAG